MDPKDPTLLVNILAEPPPKVGDKVYATSRDRRYGPNKDEDFIQEWTVVGETRMSWLIKLHVFNDGHDAERFDYKLPKKSTEGRCRTIRVGNCGTTHQTFYFDRADLEEHLWMWNNYYGIAREVERVRDPKLLRQVAALIGYSGKK